MNSLRYLSFLIFGLFANTAFANLDTIQQKIDFYIGEAKFDTAQIFIETKLEELDDKMDLSKLRYELVKVLFIRSDYDEALKQAFYGLDRISDKEQKINYNFLVACIYSATKDYNKSLDYFNLVLGQSKDASLMVQTHLLSSELYLDLKDSTKAQQSISDAFDITKQSDLDPKIEDHVAMQFNFFNQNYELCKAQNLVIIQDSTSFLSAKSFAHSMIGECLIKQDSLLEATSHLDEFLKLTFDSKDPEQIKIAASKLIEVYEKLGLQERANRYHKIYNEAMSDSLSFSIENHRDLFEVEKKRELSIAATKNSRNYLKFILGLLFILFAGTHFFLKNRKAKYELDPVVDKTPAKKIAISEAELNKIKTAVDQLIESQLFLTPNITRKSFCVDAEIKSERYLSFYINEKYKKSFSVFMNELRIEYAYGRIHSDGRFRSYKIEEIAKQSGFGSKKSFERAFVARYELTPFKLISSLMGKIDDNL